MRKSTYFGPLCAGFCAGAVTGLFGGGGGMVLIPLLTLLTDWTEDKLFPSSIAIILPICLTSLAVTACTGNVNFREGIPYLLGSGIGGWMSGQWGQHIPTKWLHRLLGMLILCGGIRYLC